MKISPADHLLPLPVLDSLLAFSAFFDVFTILNSNAKAGDDLVAAFGMTKRIETLEETELQDGRWKFGYLSYDLKNRIEKLESGNPSLIRAPDVFFFVPEIVVISSAAGIEIIAGSEEEELEVYGRLRQSKLREEARSSVQLQERTTREAYMQKLHFIKDRIRQGDIYEMNFCMEFYATDAVIQPARVYKELNAISQAPFSSFARYGDIYVIGSSPERFLRKEGTRISTQPIKGTAPRSIDPKEDAAWKENLRTSEKERNENVMIVDVSRNDLSRIAARGSVAVDELFGVYSFKQVHQMISTVSCEVKEDCTFGQIIRATFPPASMTGAPKIRAMQIIEETEDFKRGIYSGTLGYITPRGDFDLNVVIRTILYNEKEKTVSYSVGSAITDKCDPEAEYEECMLKAAAMKKVLNRG